MVVTPGVLVIHDIKYCKGCGYELTRVAERYDARQVFDIPSIKLQVTKHRRHYTTYGSCGKQNIGVFPKELTQEAQYGNRLKSLCVYLQNYQMLPYARCSEFIEDLTGHYISIGSLSNFQQDCFMHLEVYEQQIKKQLLQSAVLHANETGIRLSGKNSWMHVISNKTMSFFAHHLNRGKQAMSDIYRISSFTNFPFKFGNGTML